MLLAHCLLPSHIINCCKSRFPSLPFVHFIFIPIPTQPTTFEFTSKASCFSHQKKKKKKNRTEFCTILIYIRNHFSSLSLPSQFWLTPVSKKKRRKTLLHEYERRRHEKSFSIMVDIILLVECLFSCTCKRLLFYISPSVRLPEWNRWKSTTRVENIMVFFFRHRGSNANYDVVKASSRLFIDSRFSSLSASLVLYQCALIHIFISHFAFNHEFVSDKSHKQALINISR